MKSLYLIGYFLLLPAVYPTLKGLEERLMNALGSSSLSICSEKNSTTTVIPTVIEKDHAPSVHSVLDPILLDY